MVRLPVYSLALAFVGVLIGYMLSDDPQTALSLGGFGSLIGYILWLRARLLSMKAGKPFHVGTVINVVVCTVFAVGFGMVGIAGPDNSLGDTLVFVPLAISVVVIWLHWHFAKTAKLLPSAKEVGRELIGAVFAHELPLAAAHAAFEGAKDLVKDIKKEKD